MGQGQRSRWGWARIALATGIVLSLIIPGVAFAAGVASFSSRTPGSGASTTNTRPTIAVRVYDPYGIKGTGAFYMSVDGKAVTPSVVYYTTGSFDPAHPDYRRPRLSYRPATALAVGQHKVYVKVKDRKGHISSTTWYFKVVGPEPPYSAAFSSAAPAVESTTFVTQPTVKIHVYDKYGVSGSGTYALYVDGVRLTTRIKYTVTGVARSFDLSGKPASPLALGAHTATARVTDLHKHVTTYQWAFTVVPEPPYAATFSAMTPADGSSTLATTPLISVRVYDKYGVQGAGSYGLVVDGVAVTPTVKYTTSGSYLNLTLSYKPSVALSDGSHAVTATVTDLHANTASASWSFEVSTPPQPLVEMPVTIESSSCGSCHVGYPTTHPMTACQSCHGTGRPVPGVAYTPKSTSAHTLSCSTGVCHRGPGYAFPHVLYSDCTLCHEGQYANIPAEHGAPDATSHLSSNTYCTRSGCHQASLTIEHYRHAINGVKLSCATCHNSSDADVVATLAAGSTDCIGCHVAAGSTHKDLATAHAPAALSCTVSGCHSGSLPATHKGACAPCHAGSTVPSNVCTNCHPLDIHAAAVTQHTAPAQTCTAATCHGTNAMAIHMPRGALACQSCHAVGKTPSLVCTTCHTLDYAAIHYPGDGPHPVENECTVSGCHATGDSAVSGDVAIIHTTGKKKPGCIACHTPKATTVDCLDCHKRHSELPAHQIDPACASCHGADVSLIHTTGPKHPGCGVCHTGTGTPTAVCGTVGCHAGGVLGSHSSHPSTVTAAAITINSVDYGSHSCSECHASVELQAVHGENGTLNSCSKCHPSPAGTAAKGSFACAQGGCHTANSGNMKAMHGSIDTKHVAASLPSGWSCTTGTCHTGTNDVAKIHAPKQGCATCHGAGKVPTLSCDTAGCHPNGAPASHNAHPVTVTSGTITILGNDYADVSCGGCHKPLELQSLHGGKTSCTTCHPAPRSTFSDWNGGCVQGGCHSATSTKPMHATINTDHTPTTDAQLNCGGSNCHGTFTSLAALHASGPGCAACHNNPDHTASKICTDCHTPHDLTAAHAATPAPASVTIGSTSYGPYECATCHSPLDLRTVHKDNCSTCHAPVISKTGDVWAKGCVQGACHSSGSTKPMHAAATTAHAFTVPNGWQCMNSGCHTGADLAALHAPKQGCATCHGGTKVPTATCTESGCHTDVTGGIPGGHISLHAVVRNDTCAATACHGSADTNLTTIHAAGGCPTCHAGTVSQRVKDAIAAGDKGCANCHGFSDHKPLHEVVRNDTCAAAECHGATDTNLTTIHAAGGCATCHSDTASATIKNAIANHNKSCANCHGFTDHVSQHAVDRTKDSCAGASCHPASLNNLTTIHVAGCTTCHADGASTTVKSAIANHDKRCATCHADAHEASHAWCNDCHATATSDSGGLDHNVGPVPNGRSCSSCHGSPFVTLDGGTWVPQTYPHTCDPDCHGGIDYTPSGDLHTVVRNDTCAAASCHGSSLVNLTTIHAAGGCATCHAAGVAQRVKDAIAAHDKGCANCHGFSDHVAQHEVVRTDTCAAAACHGSSDTNLTTIHAAGGCATCHAAGVAQRVKDAIAAHDKGCANCHAFSDHVSLHAVVRNDTCAAAGCHDATKTNLTSIHAAGGCATCHSDTASTATKNAIASHDKGCANCHGFSDHVSQHAVDRTKDYCSGSGCHDASLNNLTTIHVAGCATCHAEGVSTTVKTAIANHDKACATCHANAHSASHVMCASCHTHVAGDPNDPRVPYDDGGPTHWPLTLNNRACSTCHGAPFQPLNGLGSSHQSCGSTREYGHNGCHVPAPTADQHYVARTDTCAAASCHGSSQTNLTTIHAAGGCATCHAAGVTQRVKDAVAAHNKSCSNCHGFTDHVSQHAVDRSKDYCSGSGCHDVALNNLTTIHKAGCTTCHNDGATAEVKNAIATHNKTCTACHTQPHADSHQWCTDCHNALPDFTWGEHSANPQPDQPCAACHGATFQALDGGAWVSTDAHLPGCYAQGCHNGESFGSPGNDRHSVVRSDTCAAAGCHPNGTNLTTIHSAGGCATCHASTVAQQVKDAVAAGNKSCANCHGFTDHVTQHTVVRIDTCAAAGCHDATNTNLTTIHTGGCVTCHSDTASTATKNAIASHNKDCANCHGFTDHVTQHAVVRTDTCAAAGCHDATKTNLTTIHIGGCVTCHSDTASTATKNAIATHNKSCSNCHGFTDHVTQHAVVRNDTCAPSGCHDATNTNLTTIHTGGCVTCHSDTASTATKNAIAAHNKGCANCHGFTDHINQHIVDRTKDSCAGADCHAASLNNLMTIHTAGCPTCHADTVSDTVKGAIAAHDKTCATCHTLPHAASHQWCNDCHANLDTVTNTADGEGHDPTSLMPNQPCSNCHGATFQTISGIGPAHNGCEYPTCHHSGGTLGEPTADLHYVVRNDACVGSGCHAATLTNLTTIHTGGCMTCHAATATTAVKNAIANHDKRCATCHGSGLPASHASHVSTVTAAAISINGTSYGSHSCSECHASLELQTIHGGGLASCVKCHPAPANSVTSKTFACAQAGCHVTASGNMKAQHATINADHGSSTVGSCTVAGCHLGGTDFAKVHSYTTTSCLNCHGGGKVPTANCTASGCHTTTSTANMSTLHPAMTSTHGSVTWNECNNCHDYCEDCHGYAEYNGVWSVGSDLPAIHGNCTSCHTPGSNSTTSCDNCHNIGQMQSDWSWM